MTAESIVSFPSRLSVALSSPQRVHSTRAWQSFLLCFVIQFRLLIFHKEEAKRGNWHENSGLHSRVVAKPDFFPPRVCSYSPVCLYKPRYIFGAIPRENIESNVHTRCGCGLPSWRSGDTVSSRGTSSPDGPGLSPPPWAVTAALDSPSLAPPPPPRQSASQGHRSSTSWSPSYHPSMGIRDKGVLYYCGDITEILNSTGDSLCTWKRQHSSAPCQICVDRNVTYTGNWSFISFFASNLLAHLD